MTEFTFGGYRLWWMWRPHGLTTPLTMSLDHLRVRRVPEFAQAVKTMPQVVKTSLTAWDWTRKSRELMYYQGTVKDLSGGGWYHLVGTVLEGSSRPRDYSVSGRVA